MHPFSRGFGGMNNINSLLNQQQISSLQEIMPAQMLLASKSKFDPADDDFLEQMLCSVPSSSVAAFPWTDDDNAPPQLEEQSTAALESKLRQHQISNCAAKALMLQQQSLLSINDLHSPTGADEAFFSMSNGSLGDVVDANSFKSVNKLEANEPSIKALFNGFNGSIGRIANQPQHFHHSQAQDFGAAAINQPAGSSGGGGGGQPRQRVRARRGQATDPHSIAERLRRERIAERMKALQELVPNANKTDKASMLDEIIDYVKFLQLQVKVLSMSRLGGAAAVAPLVADVFSEGKNCNGIQTASSSNNNNNNMNEGMTVTEQQVAKLMEEDMGSAMQYLQGKGLCLMPISLATAISTATTSHSMKPPLLKNHHHHPLLNADCPSPPSPSMSVLTVRFAASASAGEPSLKDATSISNP